MTEVRSPEALGDVHGFTMRMTKCVKPGSVVKAHALHDQRVAVPLAGRISHPHGLRIRRKLAAGGVNLPGGIAVLQNHDDLHSRLDHLKSSNQRSKRHAARTTVPSGNASSLAL